MSNPISIQIIYHFGKKYTSEGFVIRKNSNPLYKISRFRNPEIPKYVKIKNME